MNEAKKKISLAEGCAKLEERLLANGAAMTDLVTKFQSEFSPKRGYDGYILQLRTCGKKSCTTCPHGIIWRFYSWKGKKVLFHGRTETLPQAFWLTRGGETKVAFRNYAAAVKNLNAERTALMTAARKIKMILFHVGQKTGQTGSA